MRDAWGRKIPKKKSAVQIVADAFHGKMMEKNGSKKCLKLSFAQSVAKAQRTMTLYHSWEIGLLGVKPPLPSFIVSKFER